MLGKIIIIVLIAASAQANWFERWARSVQVSEVASYRPAGWEHSKMWIYFPSSLRSNIQDHSAIGTNTVSMAGDTNATWAIDTGWRLNTGSSFNYFVSDYSSPNSGGAGHPFTLQSWVLMESWASQFTPAISFSVAANRTTIEFNYSGDKSAYATWGANPFATRPAFTTGTWYDVAYVYDGANAYLYLNGSLRASQYVASISFPAAATNFYVGIHANLSSGNKFIGYIYSVYMTQTNWSQIDATNNFIRGRNYP